MISCCGVVCNQCQYYLKDCKGCAKVNGKVFWLEYTGEKVCQIYNCCVNEKKMNHCGKCKKLPCQFYYGNDPTKSDEENEIDLKNQLSMLKKL